MGNIPNDPIILLSFINTKLRDHYSDLDTLCEDLELKKAELEEKLNRIGFFYKREKNQFL